MTYPSGAVLVAGLSVLAACSDSGTSGAVDAAPSVADADTDRVDASEGAAARILPLGDSLTLGYGTSAEGVGTEPGYRLRLLTRLRDAGYSIDMVGSQQNGPAALDDRDHEGHNGYAVPQIAELADDAVDTYQPDIVLLMAGTNDQIELFPPSQPPADAAEDMEALIEQLHTRRPAMQIILAQIIPLNLNDAGVVAYNALLPGIVERQRARGVPIELVDMYQIGKGALSGDGIHPTQAGYDAMADIWYPAVANALSAL